MTTLKSASAAGPIVGAVAARGDRRAGEQSVGEAEADGELEVVPGRAHRRGDEVAVEADLERLLDDQLVGLAARRPRLRDALHEHALGAATSHRATCEVTEPAREAAGPEDRRAC